jgi:voltage-gated potassium channel Kch
MIARFAASLRVISGGLHAAWSDPTTKALIGLTGAIVVAASVFYVIIEGWSLLDAVFFSVATISTVGYGDVVPVTAAGRIFTVFFIFSGIGVFVVTAASIADRVIRHAREAAEKRPRRD